MDGSKNQVGPADVPDRMRGFVREHRLFDGVRRLFVGFSGGPDSTALLLLLREIASDLPLVAVHFHHGLRDAADADADWCEQFCRDRNIPFRVHRLALTVPDARSPEQAARSARMSAWKALAAAPGNAVALGHTLDDAIETFLLRAVRGAGTSGLHALRPRRVLDGILFLRPILCLDRSEITTYLRARGVHDWRIDETNLDAGYTLRNRIRHVWLPEIARNVGTTDGLLRTLEAVAEDAEFLERTAAERARSVRTPRDLADVPPALLPRVLRFWIAEQTGADVILRRAAVLRIRDAIRRGVDRECRVPFGDGLTLLLQPDALSLIRRDPDKTPAPASDSSRLSESPAPWKATLWDWRAEPRLHLGPDFILEARLPPAGGKAERGETHATVEVFAEDALPDRLLVRPRAPGDRIVPFGADYSKKVKNVFIDRKVPRTLRDAWPIVVAGDRIVWIPGVLRAEFGRVTDRTQRSVLFRLLQGPQGFGFRAGRDASGRR